MFGLWDPEEDHDKGHDVEAAGDVNEETHQEEEDKCDSRVKAECALGREGVQHAGEGEREHGGPEETSGDGPAHAHLCIYTEYQGIPLGLIYFHAEHAPR